MPNIFHVNISYFIFHIFHISLYPQIKWKLLYWEGRIKPFLQVSGILMIHDTELKKIPTLPSFLFFFSFVQQTMPFPLFNLFFLYLKERGINDCKNILLILYGFFFLKSTHAIKVDASYAENFGELHNLEEQSSNWRRCNLKAKALQQCSQETIYIFMFRVSCGKCSSWHEDLLLDTAIKQSWNCS